MLLDLQNPMYHLQLPFISLNTLGSCPYQMVQVYWVLVIDYIIIYIISTLHGDSSYVNAMESYMHLYGIMETLAINLFALLVWLVRVAMVVEQHPSSLLGFPPKLSIYSYTSSIFPIVVPNLIINYTSYHYYHYYASFYPFVSSSCLYQKSFII